MKSGTYELLVGFQGFESKIAVFAICSDLSQVTLQISCRSFMLLCCMTPRSDAERFLGIACSCKLQICSSFGFEAFQGLMICSGCKPLTCSG